MGEQVCIRSLNFSRRIEKVSEQGEKKIAVAIGQEPDFQALRQFVDVRARTDQRGNATRVRASSGIPSA